VTFIDTKGSRPRLTLALLCVAQFVDVLGVTIVITALPSIQRGLGFPEQDLHWVVSIYALSFGGFIMLTGRAADLYGRRRMFMAGLILFACASLAAGLAKTPVFLVIARAAQGLGAAVVVPAALSILTTTFSESTVRSRALGVWTAAGAGGGAAGFFLGGLITGTLDWRWVFLINVPVAAVGTALAPMLLSESRAAAATRRLDFGGGVTATAGFLALIYGFTRVQDAGIRSPFAWGSLVAGILLLMSFAFIERRAKDPLVPSGVFRSRNLVGANLVAFLITGVTSPAAVLGTLYLQRVREYSPTAAGLTYMPGSLLVVVGSLVGARLIVKSGARLTMVSGLGLIVASLLLMSFISVGGGLAFLIAGIALSGFGLGCASVASTSAGTSTGRDEDQGLVSGLLNTAAQLGTAIGIALLVTVATTRTAALSGGGEPAASSLVGGFHLAFYVAAALAAAGAVGASLLVPRRSHRDSRTGQASDAEVASPR
jgi:EmrB/QacA subfamily drug resistance transporter